MCALNFLALCRVIFSDVYEQSMTNEFDPY